VFYGRRLKFFYLGVRLGFRFYNIGLSFKILVSRYFGVLILSPEPEKSKN
jgi:hypothetical protein